MATKTKAFLLFGTILVLLVGGRVIFLSTQHPDDKTLIKQALEESIKASREGRPGGVMDKLSANLKYNGQNAAGAERDIARYIKSSKPEVEVENPDPIISGNEAKIVSPVKLTISMLGQSIERKLKDVTIVFEKEDDREWLVIPVKKWKLAEVQVPEASVSDLGMP